MIPSYVIGPMNNGWMFPSLPIFFYYSKGAMNNGWIFLLFSTVSPCSVKIIGPDLITRCDCGLRAPLRTSWTGANPRRCFFECVLYDIKSIHSLPHLGSSFSIAWLNNVRIFHHLQKAWEYFSWFDSRTCPLGMEVRPHLLKKIKDMQSEVALLKRFVTVLKCMLGVSWVVIAIMGVLLCST